MAKKKVFNFISQNLLTELGYLKSFLIGFVISASGSMVIGALHLLAIQISVEKNWMSAILFSCGCALVETIFVRYLAVFTLWLSKRKNGLQILEWLMLILFSSMTLVIFYGVFNVSTTTTNWSISTIVIPTFLLGMGIRLFYPSMIPFWLAWNTALTTRAVKFKTWAFAMGAGVATVIMHSMYIFAGTLLVEFLKEKSQEILILIGVMFLITTCLQAKRMFWKKDNTTHQKKSH